MLDRIYAIVHCTRREAYIGRTYRTLAARWAEHVRAAKGARSNKTLSEALRFEPDAWEILECEHSDSASEAEWIELFKNEGYLILNDTGGNRAKPKQRDKEAERAWREVNLNAVQALNGPASPNRYAEICALLQGTGPGPWERFAAANPDYIAELKQSLQPIATGA